ncbi:DUF6355 family natural product biosynthesis protein [Streptomyces tritici]|uniref:DUF6355 family natural product biosynthesis protein n=1 Tax=Streptomyces tritici TaxID=2054410 RepID=UPI003AEF6F9F
MLRSAKRVLGTLSAGAVLAGSALFAAAGPAAAGGCGHWSESSIWWGVRHYYTHCTSDGSTVLVHAERRYVDDTYHCVGPNETLYLGLGDSIVKAYYAGRLC